MKNIIIDPRIELLTILQLISNYDEKFDIMTKFEFPYKSDVKNSFSGFLSHVAVKTFNELSEIGFSYDAPPTAILYLSNPPDMAQIQDYDINLKARVGAKKLRTFASKLRRFAKDIGFNEFYEKNQRFYKSIIDKNKKIIGNSDYITEMEQYYGIKQNQYNIILAPLYRNVGFALRIKNSSGDNDIYSIQGPSSIENGIPVFGSKESFIRLAWHEFGHSFVNPIIEEHANEIQKYSSLYTPIADIMSASAYNDWQTCVKEHIVRAVTTRLIYMNDGKNAYDSEIALEKSRGFFYIEALNSKLEEFENNREKYKTFTDFYPELVKVFKKLT